MRIRSITAARLAVLAALLALPQASHAHVTLQTGQTLRPGVSFANITLNVPNERHVDNTKVTLAIPEAFLKAGGRLNRLIYPQGWTVTLEKQDKPGDVYNQEKESRAKRDSERQQAGAEHTAPAAATTEGEKQEQAAMDELRKKWITKVTFEGGAIPPEGFQQFQLNFQMPDEPGSYRFAAVQTYVDGKEVSWSELVEGAEHPAATLNVVAAPLISYSDLPLPLSVMALLLAVAAFFRKSGANGREKAAAAASAHPQLASLGRPGAG
jgi:uncharacterized protein YcnI